MGTIRCLEGPQSTRGSSYLYILPPVAQVVRDQIQNRSSYTSYRRKISWSPKSKACVRSIKTALTLFPLSLSKRSLLNISYVAIGVLEFLLVKKSILPLIENFIENRQHRYRAIVGGVSLILDF